VRALDLPNEAIGKVSLGGMVFLEIKGRLPSHAESNMFDAVGFVGHVFEEPEHSTRRRSGSGQKKKPPRT
jgi:hypothetical protein